MHGGAKKLLEKNVKKSPPVQPVEYYSWVEGGKYVSPDNQTYILPNNNQFPGWIFDRYNDFQLSEAQEASCDVPDDTEVPFLYQQFVREYLSYVTPYRGLLLYYGLGSGKTRAALEIARPYRNMDWGVILISPAALVDNFVGEMGKWGFVPQSDADRIIGLKTRKSRNAALGAHGFYMVSYDAPNKTQQLKEALEVGGRGTKGRLRNKVIIVDEAHNMAQFIHNGLNQSGDRHRRTTTNEFYNILLGATNCRYVMLSGTPIINVPGELAIIFNILRGPMRWRPKPASVIEVVPPAPLSVRNDETYYPALPVSVKTFNDLFIDWKNLSVKQGLLFQKRILGLVAYYSGARGDVYPDVLGPDLELMDPNGPSWTVVQVPMSEVQLISYSYARAKEQEEPLRKPTPASISDEILGAITAPDQETAESTFRIKSRQISNFALPTYLRELRPTSIIADPIGIEELYREFDRITESIGLEEENLFKLPYLESFSPKMATMLQKIQETIANPETDGNILVYSNFRSVEGIELFSKVLENNGFAYFNILEQKPTDKPTFAIVGRDRRIGGGDYTTDIINIYNSEANQRGDRIKVILGTANIAEGISLFNVRLVQIMEPHWNMVRINQVVGRARRICSHRNLPRKHWNFQVYLYISIIPEEFKHRFEGDTISTDEVVYKVALRKETVKNKFIHLIREASVDCQLNATHNQNLAQRPPVHCLTFPSEDARAYTYFPNIKKDPLTAETPTETLGWIPFTDVDYSKFYDQRTGKPKYAIIVDPVTRVDQIVRIKIPEEGDKEFLAKALYDRSQLEFAGEFVLKGYLIQGKPVWPLYKP